MEQVAVKSAVDDDKYGLLSKTIKEAVDTAKATLSALKGHLESLKDIGGDGKVVGEAVSDVSAGKEGTAANGDELKKVLKAFKGIVEIAETEGVKKPEVGDIAVKIGNGTDNKDGIKILATDSGNKPSAGNESKAAAILTTVSGENILASIVASAEGDEVLGAGASSDKTTAMSFAKGGDSGSSLATGTANTAKAAAVAGGIALRSLVKGGQLATGAQAGNGGGKEEVQKVGITAVNKLLVAVEDVIKRTIKETLKRAKEKIDKSRASKATVQQ